MDTDETAVLEPQEAPETEAPEPPEQPQPEAEAPAWDYGEPEAQPEQPQYVTRADMEAMLAQQRPERREPSSYEDPLDQRLAAIQDLQYSDPVKAERMRLEIAREQIAEFAAQAAYQRTIEAARPQLAAQIAGEVTKGLPPETAEFIRAQLGSVEAQALAGLQGNKQALNSLRYMAEGHAAQAKPKVQPPASGGVRAGGNGQSQEVAEMIDMYKQMGLSDEEAAQIAKASVK
jgi:hypothetical protein